MRDLNETIKHRKDSIQYTVLGNNLKKIFGGGVLYESIFSLAFGQFVVCFFFFVSLIKFIIFH